LRRGRVLYRVRHVAVALVAARVVILCPKATARTADDTVHRLRLLESIELKNQRIAPIAAAQRARMKGIRVKAEALAKFADHVDHLVVCAHVPVIKPRFMQPAQI